MSAIIQGARLDGVDALEGDLRRRVANVEQGAALVDEAELIGKRSDELCPVETGALRGSRLNTLHRRGFYSEVEITYGGGEVDYAIYVHEILTNVHPVGQAKFLETAFKEAQGKVENRLGPKVGAELLR